MKKIQLHIEALSPLAIGKKKAGAITTTEDYIHGSVIRGAIAANLLKESGHSHQDLTQDGGDFQALFLGDRPAIFHNAYPATIQNNRRTLIQDEVKVLPATALSSKTNPGFLKKSEKRSLKKEGGIFDTLIDRFCSDRYGQPYDPISPTDEGRVDSPGITFYSKLHGKYYSHSVNKRLLTRVGINRRRATAEEQILYSIEVLNESEGRGEKPRPVSYSGSILVPENNLAEQLTQFINARQTNFRLGGSLSRGLGKVKMVAKLVDINSQIESRVTNFNEKLNQRWQEWSETFDAIQSDWNSDRIFFTIDLQSDAILNEDWRRTTVISERMLQDFSEIEDSSLKLHVAYSSYDYCSGWNAAWGRMKDMELVTNKGAVYLFSTNQKELWLQSLAELENKGIGERTLEGFGQIQVCNEFHLELWDNPV